MVSVANINILLKKIFAAGFFNPISANQWNTRTACWRKCPWLGFGIGKSRLASSIIDLTGVALSLSKRFIVTWINRNSC